MCVETPYGLCFVGFGNVGQGLARILVRKERELKDRWGFTFRTVAVVTRTRGAAVSGSGLSLPELLEKSDRGEPIGNDRISPIDAALLPDTNIVLDVTPTNLVTGEPGLSLTRAALGAGRSVVSSNKGPVSLALSELKELARARGVRYRFEGSVLSGTPSLNLALESLAGCDVQKVQGIVNGTTNFILTRMEEGVEYAEALREAQEKGYAEADPAGDVDGWDAAVKAQILAAVVLGSNLSLGAVKRTGISAISRNDVESALSRGKRIKLIAKAARTSEGTCASIAPVEIPLSHPLACVGGAMNALTFTTDNLKEITIIGPGAGREETGQALLSDMLAIVSAEKRCSPGRKKEIRNQAVPFLSPR
ncbi:MAG: homoserine dehydrogenase [Synergistaceae bacterium]|jgi:homoserine dehydrogenase|uniref:homoserine dehydrogenase n=1 Tax=Aminivibrio sp. TaxID=1872489 RepID=UPI0016A233C9|nr:homoserine dehydrogenase [Synergistaceae bacterium]MDD3688786.1 homoserine dehydrogenase [Synergistaceae bacterium]MDD4611963.1 homoserine dehydrogenase [Synergistaceae bacterium]NLO59297.1 homoserine dehydrogenase [Synergistaceae bacterium]